MPSDFGPLTIHSSIPRTALPSEGGEVRNPAGPEALAGEEADLDLGLIQPTAVFRRQCAVFWSDESLVRTSAWCRFSQSLSVPGSTSVTLAAPPARGDTLQPATMRWKVSSA